MESPGVIPGGRTEVSDDGSADCSAAGRAGCRLEGSADGRTDDKWDVG